MIEPELDAARKELSDEIDAAVHKLGCDFYTSELLQKQNANYKEQIKQLIEDQQNMNNELECKNRQIIGFMETIGNVNQKALQHGQHARETFSFQANTVRMQYEVMCLAPIIVYFFVLNGAHN